MGFRKRKVRVTPLVGLQPYQKEEIKRAVGQHEFLQTQTDRFMTEETEAERLRRHLQEKKKLERKIEEIKREAPD